MGHNVIDETEFLSNYRGNYIYNRQLFGIMFFVYFIGFCYFLT